MSLLLSQTDRRLDNKVIIVEPILNRPFCSNLRSN